MSIVAIILLVVLWAAVLVPPLLRNRRELVSRDSVGAFRSQLDTLGRAAPAGSPGGSVSARAASFASGGGWPGVPRNASEAEARRRDILMGLAVTAVVTLVGAALVASALWPLHLLVDVTLIGYVVLLARHRAMTVRRDQDVHYVHGPHEGDVTAEHEELVLADAGR